MAQESGDQRFCTNCGNPLVPEATFCSSCGTPVGQPETATVTIPPSFGEGPVNLGFAGTGLQALGYGLWAAILMILIIPYGWGVSVLSGWYVNNLAFSDGRTATFTGRGSQIWYYVFLILLTSLLNVIPVIGGIIGWLVSFRLQLGLVRWFFSHIELSTGQSPRFEGSYWPFVGWYILWAVSFITIIGWAWVASAGMRWLCRNVDMGAEERLEFVGSGLEFLWRGIVVVMGSIFIITIPWLAVWYLRWITSNILIQPRATQQP